MIDSRMDAGRLGEIESELERALSMVAAARAALLELEAAKGHVYIKAPPIA